jgi:hypothetical protein
MVLQFLKAIKRLPDKVAERLFNLFDYDLNGILDFGEFVRGLRAYCAYSPFSLVMVAFDLFDLRDLDTVGPEDIELGLRQVLTVTSDDDKLFRRALHKALRAQLGKDPDDSVTRLRLRRRQFADLAHRHRGILIPAIEAQECLRQAFGKEYWQSAVKDMAPTMLIPSQEYYQQVRDFLRLGKGKLSTSIERQLDLGKRVYSFDLGERVRDAHRVFPSLLTKQVFFEELGVGENERAVRIAAVEAARRKQSATSASSDDDASSAAASESEGAGRSKKVAPKPPAKQRNSSRAARAKPNAPARVSPGHMSIH